MFKRRIKRTWWVKMGHLMWPRGGWHRSSRYIFHRVARIPGSPYSITAGFACGAAASCTPFIGLHFVIAALLAWMMRANIVTSAIGTIVGNPWTFPFIWVWIYKLGSWISASSGHVHHSQLDFAKFFSQVTHAVLDGNMSYLAETAAPIIWPMFIGAIPTAIVVWVVTYMVLKPLVSAYQHRRRRRNTDLPMPEGETAASTAKDTD